MHTLSICQSVEGTAPYAVLTDAVTRVVKHMQERGLHERSVQVHTYTHPHTYVYMCVMYAFSSLRVCGVAFMTLSCALQMHAPKVDMCPSCFPSVTCVCVCVDPVKGVREGVVYVGDRESHTALISAGARARSVYAVCVCVHVYKEQ